jgi:hypothetical protein
MRLPIGMGDGPDTSLGVLVFLRYLKGLIPGIPCLLSTTMENIL